MEQMDVKQKLEELYSNVPNSLSAYHCIDECEFYADKLSFEGYGQNNKGYIGYKGIQSPTQKFHIIEAYYGYNIENNVKCRLKSVKCPQFIIWLAEIVGIDVSEGYNYIRDTEDKLKKNGISKPLVGATEYWYYNTEAKLEVLKYKVHYNKICEIIERANTWDEVLRNCNELK